MTKQKVYLLTGPVQSGKTSALWSWTEHRKDLQGFLTPDMQGKRKFVNLADKIVSNFEIDQVDISTCIEVGKYKFKKEIFEMGQSILNMVMLTKNTWILVDEIGMLELNNQGFEPAFSNFISRFKAISLDSKCIIVVRESLLEQVKTRYQLQEATVISIFDLHEL